MTFDMTDLSDERWAASSNEDKTRIDWYRDWVALKEVEREFLTLIFPEIIDRDKVETKNVQRCINSAFVRAFKRDWLEEEVCSRCNGDGQYSWNRVHGSMCYGCNGTGIGRPRITKTLIARLKKNMNGKNLKNNKQRRL